MELEINGKIYKFKFGMGFLRKIQATKQTLAGMTTVPAGFKFAVAGLYDEDPEWLEKILLIANETEDPRITEEEMDEYFDTADLNKLFKDTKSFLSKANVCKKMYKELMDEFEKEAKKQQALEKN